MADYDVLIAGYGPTGAVAANLLGALGHHVLVVEPELEVYEIPRAVHFDGEIMRIFQSLGLAQSIREFSAQGEMIRFTNGRNWNLFQQDLTVVPRHHGWYNNQFFDQPQLEKTLRNGVQRYDNVEVRLGWAVESIDTQPEGVHLELARVTAAPAEHEITTAQFVLACDGASSPIRKMLDIPQQDLHCDEPWLVCDLKLGDGVSFDRTGLQICDPKRPTTLIPCEGDHIRWEFMLNADDDITEMEDEKHVRALMAPHMHRLSPELTSVDGKLVRAKVYTFHALLAESFQQQRVFLLGDAAHQTPPFLGQGMCTGLRDAHNLAWKLHGVLDGKYPSTLLDTYSTERRPQVHTVISTAVGHGAVIQTRNPLQALIRDCFLMLGRVFPILVSFLKFGDTWQLGSGLFVTNHIANSNSPVARPFPQGKVRTQKSTTETTQWSDELLGSEFVLVSFTESPPASLASEFDWLSTLHLHPQGDAYEVEGEIMSWAAEHDVAFALVRPDRYVYAICENGGNEYAALNIVLSELRLRLQTN